MEAIPRKKWIYLLVLNNSDGSILSSYLLGDAYVVYGLNLIKLVPHFTKTLQVSYADFACFWCVTIQNARHFLYLSLHQDCDICCVRRAARDS